MTNDEIITAMYRVIAEIHEQESRELSPVLPLDTSDPDNTTIPNFLRRKRVQP